MRLRPIVILALTLLNAQALLGQITGNLNVKDPKALAITPERRAALCGKKWTCLGLVEVRRGIRDEFEQFGRNVEFDCSGEYKYYSSSSGKWTVINEQFLSISTPERRNSTPLLKGSYSVYFLSDSTLVLGQILTSSGDWTKEYTFTSSTKPPVSSRPKWTYAPDSLKNGKQVKYYSNGQVSSITSYHLVKKKVTAEDLFLNNGSLPADRYDRHDSTRLESVPDGDWTYYFPDGKISSKCFYSKEGQRVGKWVRFFSDGRLDETETYNTDGRLYFRDHYEYRKGETLPIVRREYPKRSSVFVVGNKDSVEFNQIDFREVGRAGSYAAKRVGVKNLSQRKVTVAVLKNLPLDVKASQVEIGVNDSAVLELTMRVPEGAAAELIQVKSAEWAFSLNFDCFGYHLSNADFDSNVKRALPSRFFFHRVSDEYELEIATARNEKFVPVSKQMSAIELKKGQYQFTLIGPSGRKTIDVEIQ